MTTSVGPAHTLTGIDADQGRREVISTGSWSRARSAPRTRSASTSARFAALARPGEPLRIECHATQLRRRATNVLARYSFRFHQGSTLIYEGDQTAFWIDATKTKDEHPS
jgi:hypothetical protein